MMRADNIIAAARECLETPFKHQGRQLGRGLDCAGVAVHVARRIGADFIDASGYGRNPVAGQMEAALDAQPCLQALDDIADRLPGDLLLMRFDEDPQHLAIFAGDTIIHGYQRVRKVCEHRLDEVWAARIVGVYRFVGVVNE